MVTGSNFPQAIRFLHPNADSKNYLRDSAAINALEPIFRNAVPYLSCDQTYHSPAASSRYRPLRNSGTRAIPPHAQFRLTRNSASRAISPPDPQFRLTRKKYMTSDRCSLARNTSATASGNKNGPLPQMVSKTSNTHPSPFLPFPHASVVDSFFTSR